MSERQWRWLNTIWSLRTWYFVLSSTFRPFCNQISRFRSKMCWLWSFIVQIIAIFLATFALLLCRNYYGRNNHNADDETLHNRYDKSRIHVVYNSHAASTEIKMRKEHSYSHFQSKLSYDIFIYRTNVHRKELHAPREWDFYQFSNWFSSIVFATTILPLIARELNFKSSSAYYLLLIIIRDWHHRLNHTNQQHIHVTIVVGIIMLILWQFDSHYVTLSVHRFIFSSPFFAIISLIINYS